MTSAYRKVSGIAVPVIAGTIHIDLKIGEDEILHMSGKIDVHPTLRADG